MKPLPDQFTSGKFRFRQLARARNVVLLEKTNRLQTWVGYEVVIVRCRPAQHILGRDYEARESMPPNEAWGSTAWSFMDLPSAQFKYRQLIDPRAKPGFAAPPVAQEASQTEIQFTTTGSGAGVRRAKQ